MRTSRPPVASLAAAGVPPLGQLAPISGSSVDKESIPTVAPDCLATFGSTPLAVGRWWLALLFTIKQAPTPEPLEPCSPAHAGVLSPGRIIPATSGCSVGSVTMRTVLLGSSMTYGSTPAGNGSSSQHRCQDPASIVKMAFTVQRALPLPAIRPAVGRRPPDGSTLPEISGSSEAKALTPPAPQMGFSMIFGSTTSPTTSGLMLVVQPRQIRMAAMDFNR